MTGLPVEGLQHAIRETHGAESRLIDQVQVEEQFEGEPVFSGTVAVFELIDHPTADRCYAWLEGREVVAVLHTGPVDSPAKAVRASILAG